jgi:iron complex transport system substrate-binding protein
MRQGVFLPTATLSKMKDITMKRSIFLISLVVMLVLAISACAAPTATAQPTTQPTAIPTQGPLEFTDGLGRTVTFALTPQRIVSLAPSATEILYAVGADAQMVGRDSFSNFPEEATALADVGGSMGSYSYEVVTSLNPDLVVAAEINTPEQVKALEDLGLTVYYIGNPASLEDLYSILQTLGQITGHAETASALVDSLKTRVDTVTAKTAAVKTTPLVFYELDGSEPSKPWTAGPGTFIDLLITKAGGRNVGSVLSGSWAQISAEELLLQNPQIILLGDAAYGTTPEQVASRAGWNTIDAVINGKVFAFNDDLVSRPGPRLVDALEELSKLLHPEFYQ